MAAYSAVVCFEHLLEQLLSIHHFAEEEVVSLQVKISNLKESIDRIFPAPQRETDAANKLGAEIRDAVYKAQDAIESFLSIDSVDRQKSSFSLQEIEANMDPIVVEAEIRTLSIGRNKTDLPHEKLTYKPNESVKKTRIVGQEKDKEHVTAMLLSHDSRRMVIPITGMVGVGKTTLAMSIFHDPNIMDKFPYRAWVTVSQDYSVTELLAKLLIYIDSKGRIGGEEKIEVGSSLRIREKLHQSLYNNKYLVVIDDLWEDTNWMDILNSLPDNGKSSRILVTTRLQNVAKSVKSTRFPHEMEPLNKDDSWSLLQQRTFGDSLCPTQLVKVGRRIAKNCCGLPLTLISIGGLLSQEEKTEEYWKSIEGDTYAAAAKGAASYLEILSLSYSYLPSKLKGCFLYMAAFPRDTEVVVSKLIKLWVAEGFLTEPSLGETIEQVAERSLEQLIDRSLVVVQRSSSCGRVKTCRMHDSLRELAQREAEKEKFLYSVKKNQVEELERGAESQRRVSVHETVVMCRRQVYQTTKSIRLARSLLYVDPSYPHALPFCLTFDLLRVFDAFTVFFMEFPDEIIKLIHLRYLSFTFNGKLPSSLSKLKRLQILMVRRKPKIIMIGISFLPEETWDMPQLRHLLVTETEMPLLRSAKNSVILLPNLQSLSNVSAVSCTQEVLGHMPSLKKLGMWLESPCDLFLYLKQVPKLESFTFKVLNPDPCKSVNLSGDGLFFPETVMKLDLSGCGLPWEDMEVIQSLPNLQVLKLRELAFNGDEWCPINAFTKLKHLMIEYLNLKWLETDGSHFPCLQRLIIRHCYELEGIPRVLGGLGFMELIELVDCSPDAVESAMAIEEEQKAFNNKFLQVRIYDLQNKNHEFFRGN